MRRPWSAAIRAAAITSLLFVVLYNACNQLTHIRPDVQTWVFAWERHTPFVPALIVPYWSIDALFFAAPFLAASTEEVALLRRRLVFVIIGGAIGFLLIPLQLAFPRPEVTGMFGPWFATLRGFDQPHNLFPSLHIALRTVLAEFYARTIGGATRWLVHVWFALIGLSTLLTWQHQIIDVLGGFWLAALAMELVRVESAERKPARPNATVAWIYGLVAVMCTQLARLDWPWTFVFVWPAFALAGAAAAYAGIGVLYRKVDGRLTWSTRFLFAPMLAGQWVSWWWYRRKSAAWDELTPNVWLGRVLTEKEARTAIAAGVTAVLDLTAEFTEPAAFRALRYCNIQILDLTAPTESQLVVATDFIAREAGIGIVYVHCKAGYSRTAAAAAGWMLANGRVESAEQAFEQLRAIRPRIVIRPEIRALFRAAPRGKPPLELAREHPGNPT